MDIHPPPSDTFAAIYWTRDDLLGVLARRADYDFSEEPMKAANVGMTDSQLDDLERSIAGILEDMSIECGWEVIEESLDWRLGTVDERRERGEHPNGPRG